MISWNKYNLFKLPNKHRRFEYVPRYYDPRKEELEKKIRAAQKAAAKNGGEGDASIARELSFRQNTSDKWGNSEYKAQAMRSNLRLVIIFIIVLIGFYFLYQYLDDVGAFIDKETGK
ncbi:hypothetical protein K6119_00225 [Paracrocinitomix mangrovi]|uniref:hypothetical protein n=1 Tax=Paracrocinitomix mangrovi TaxID=2862509 RepID=UPI001C8E6330|nr:hypothetical protein [Paracrocinitomix mangrovi]UKN01941.1 hypothetical protein K6119_00225 [Paracrocinitomix mangrovi]